MAAITPNPAMNNSTRLIIGVNPVARRFAGWIAFGRHLIGEAIMHREFDGEASF